MTRVLVVVLASRPPLLGSSVSTAFEQFCNQRLVDRALALAGDAIVGADPIVVAAPEIDEIGVTNGASFFRTTTKDLYLVLREAAEGLSSKHIGLAIDPRHPMLSAATLRALIASANEGHIAAAGRSPMEPAALAMDISTERDSGGQVTLIPVPDRELPRVDSKEELIRMEQEAYTERARGLLASGLLIRDPRTTRVDGSVSFGLDVEIGPGCTLHGPIVLGNRVRVGPHCILSRVTIGDDTEIRPFSIVEDSSIDERCFVGPYARVRPGTSAGPNCQIGNFVEIKAAHLGRGNRINHLSFVGDSMFGDEVTIGAGTITCNHDGVRCHTTTIGAGTYVGSGCVLVAPISIGERATIGAGSAITKDAPSAKLTVARSRQVVVEGWGGLEAKRK